jgi:glutamate:GABA antiporter
MGQSDSAEKTQMKVFVRESTGLVKTASLLDSVSLNISDMSIGALLGVMGLYGYLVGSVSGLNLIYASALAFVLSFPQVIIYTMMSRRFPRTGGDYVWISRTFGGFWGSTLSFMGYTMETGAYLALITLSAVFAIGAVGFFQSLFSNSTLFGLSLPVDAGGVASSQFIVGAILFAALILINIVKPKGGFKLVSALTVFSIGTLVVAILTLLAGGHAAVVNYVNSSGMTVSQYLPPGVNDIAPVNATLDYNTIANAYVPSSNWITPALFILPLIFAFVYPWINAAPAVASEIKGRTALRWNVPISAALAFILLTSSLGTLYYVGGQAFINEAFSSWSVSVFYTFNFWTLAMGVAGLGTPLAWLIGLGWITWNVAILAYGIIIISRYLLAQSLDRFLPSKISYVSPRFGSPLNAHVIDLVLTVTLVGLAAFYYGTVSALFGSIIASMIYFTFMGLTAATYAIKKEKGAPRAILATAGIFNAIIFAFLAYEFVAYPEVWGLQTLSYWFVVFSFILAAALFLGSRTYHRKRGIDISAAYKELPPD